jgi:hypothetical protein
MYTKQARPHMPRKKPSGPSVPFQLRLRGEEAERWLKIKSGALVKNPRINDIEINRRLLGLDPDIDGAVTEKDRLFFAGGKPGKSEVGLAGRPQSTKPDLRQVSPTKTKRSQAR